ncbi:3-deoxy-7-phosphoheptulonate synthase [Candidatus Woesearchaeota archaeon]|nr:3-deoxy-7-phosphoheptulonate synthase [Candidatus Woesearchaeota archaeon]
MIIVMKPHIPKEEIERVIDKIKSKGLEPVPLYGVERTVIAVIGDSRKYEIDGLKAIKSIEKITKILKPYKLASREYKSETTVIKVEDVEIGNDDFTVIAGPCSIENEEQIMTIAGILKDMGIRIMRASAFKPRTSPYSFQGLGIKGLKLLKQVKEKTGLIVETEVMDVRDVKVSAEYVDILRIGARNMQNFDLLKEVGKLKKPVILKRGMNATLNELIMAAEYILSRGNPNVILCERGIRTFETSYRNTLDISAVPMLKKITHLPVIVDPSHASGKRELILPLSKAAVAVGADGLMIEVHPNPEEALSDAAQSLYPKQFKELLDELKPLCEVCGRHLKCQTNSK